MNQSVLNHGHEKVKVKRLRLKRFKQLRDGLDKDVEGDKVFDVFLRFIDFVVDSSRSKVVCIEEKDKLNPFLGLKVLIDEFMRSDAIYVMFEFQHLFQVYFLPAYLLEKEIMLFKGTAQVVNLFAIVEDLFILLDILVFET